MSKFLDENGLQYFWSKLKTSLNNKVDKITGKGLSTEDYTTAEKTKLAGIASGAEVNVQSDWNQTDSSADDFIKNKPTVPTVDQTFDATSQNPQSGVAIAGILNTAPLRSSTINVEFTMKQCSEAYNNGRKYALYCWGGGMLGLLEKKDNDLPAGTYMVINDFYDNDFSTPLIITISPTITYPMSIYQFTKPYSCITEETPPKTIKYKLDSSTRYYRIGDL